MKYFWAKKWELKVQNRFKLSYKKYEGKKLNFEMLIKFQISSWNSKFLLMRKKYQEEMLTKNICTFYIAKVKFDTKWFSLKTIFLIYTNSIMLYVIEKALVLDVCQTSFSSICT